MKTLLPRTLVLVFLFVGCQPEPKSIVLKATPPLPTTGALVVHSVGPAVLLVATAESEQGKTIRSAKIAFVSSDPKVATVDFKGVVNAVKSGTTKISATSGKARAEFDVTVSIPAHLELCAVDLLSAGHCPASGASMVMHAGHRGEVALRLFDDSGHEIDPDEDKEHPMAQVSSENVSVATVDPSGAVVALAPGQASLSAHAGSVRASLPLKVEAPDFDRLEVTPKKLALKPGKSSRLAAVARRKKAAVANVAVNWATGNASVATVSPDGIVKAVGKGKATITAGAGGKSFKVAVDVK